MKRNVLAFGVLAALLCCTLAYAATWPSAPRLVPQRSNPQDSTAYVTPGDSTAQPDPAIPAASYGVSIGTVEAKSRYEVDLDLPYFGNVSYIAQTGENTYLGFEVSTDWVDDDKADIHGYVANAVLGAVFSEAEAITIPDSISADGKVFPVARIYSDYYLYYSFTQNIKILTIPASVKSIYYNYDFDRNLQAMYMLGEAPSVNGQLRVPNVYVCDAKNVASYIASDEFTYCTIIPYGWDYDWLTVNVEKPGEFAETYLTQNDYDWSAGINVKVTGNINSTDLSAIKNLNALQKLDLSETTITTLPDNFMYERRSLKEVVLPSTMAKLGNRAFYGCTALASFDLNGITTIGDETFRDCTSLGYINLKGVNKIQQSAFKGCTSLNNIDLSDVEYIEESAFESCRVLEAVDLTSVARLGGNSYGNNTNGRCFRGCTSLRQLTFGDKLTYIPRESFYNCQIDTLVIPEGIVQIDYSAFANCTSLKMVSVPSTLETISSRVFNDCSALNDVRLQSGLKNIENSAFSGCTALTEFTVPSTVQNIGSSAFDYTSITTFKCHAAVPPLASASFIGVGMDMSRTYLYVPSFSKDFYRNTQYWSNFYLMRSLQESIDYIYVDRELAINLEEEDNAAVADKPKIELSYSSGDSYDEYGNSVQNIGQLTATGEGTLSAGELEVNARLALRYDGSYGSYGSSLQWCPTLINHTDKMRADNVKHNFEFYGGQSSYTTYWYFVSLPYDAKVSDINPSKDTYWVIRRYDSAARAAGESASTWVNLTNDDTLEAGKGYIISLSGGETFVDKWGSKDTRRVLSFTSGNSMTKNNIFRPGDVIVTLDEYPAEFAHNRSWNLIGNPYPCYFDMHCLGEGFTAPVTIWNGQGYTAYSPIDDDLVLGPYEAFFVQCPLESTEITFKENGRLHSAQGRPSYRMPAKTCSEVSAEGRNVFNFNIAGEGCNDRARIVLNPDAAMEYEVGRDAAKFFADGSSQIFVAADVACSICERPVGDATVTLGMNAAADQLCTLSLDGRFSTEWSVIVTDNVTGKCIDLTKEAYQFAATGNDAGRFGVVFKLASSNSIEGITGDFGPDAIVTVNAVNGTVVFKGRLADLSVPTAGMYLISCGGETRKAILK